MFEERNIHTPVSKLGEFGLINHLTEDIKLKHTSTVKGVGDDAAVIEHGNELTLVSKDLLAEGVHFDIMYTPLKHLGYKAIVSNVSDIVAMNGTPKQILIGLALSSKYTVEALEEIYNGIHRACDKYNLDIIGGDTTSSQSGLVISITIIGTVQRENLIYRNTAREGDLICVSGDLGAAYMGLQVLEREKAVFKKNNAAQPDLEHMHYLLERQLKPEARMDILDIFKEAALKPTAMIDISDGLASEIIHICKQSNTGCLLYEEKLPIDHVTYETAREFNLDPTICALNGGEDYELLFTINPADLDSIKKYSSEITIIGHITDAAAGYHLVAKNNTQHPITAQGWDALLKK